MYISKQTEDITLTNYSKTNKQRNPDSIFKIQN